MRAHEFVTESKKKGKMHPTHAEATPGAIRNAGYYDLYRASMAMASMPDGEHEADASSWIGRDGFVGTYTPEEHEIATKAFKHLGFKVGKHMEGPSREPEAVNTTSPVKGFKGYPR